jgi:hypothetical protein
MISSATLKAFVFFVYLANVQQCHPCFFLISGSIAAEVFPQKKKKKILFGLII